MGYDETYSKTADYFGSEPSELLVEYLPLIDKSQAVLDIGAGQGRNALYVARQGYTVDAVEPSQVGIDIINRAAEDEKLSLYTYCTGLENFLPDHAPYGAILLFGIVQLLSWDSITILIDKVKSWTAPGSHILLSAFITDDPGFEKMAASEDKAGKNSYRLADGSYRTALEPGEALTLFHGYEVIHHWEGMGHEHRHGGKPPHRHASVHAVFRRSRL